MAVMGLIPKIDLPLGVPITIQSLGVMLAVMAGLGTFSMRKTHRLQAA